MARTKQQLIAGIMDRLDPMVESPSMGGMGGGGGGGRSGMGGMGGMGASNDDSTLSSVMGDESQDLVEPDCETGECGGEENFTEFQLKVAKRFIEIMGNADKARSVIDKVDDCQECLGLVDDEENDGDAIGQMADMMPGSPDLPMELSNLYNPSAAI